MTPTTLLILILALATLPAAAQVPADVPPVTRTECLPKEAGGLGSKIRRASAPGVEVLVWNCGADQQWLGVRGLVVLGKSPQEVALALSKYRVQHGYDRLGMADLAPLVGAANTPAP